MVTVILLLYMGSFVLPHISEDFKTGQPFVGVIHPSLAQLNAYITRKFKHDFVGVDIIALTDYIADTNQSWANGNYYLFGQIQTGMNDPLTNELLETAIQTFYQRAKEYGEPYNQFEANSINRSIDVFRNLLYLLQTYDLMEMYKPDGEFMTKVIEESC
jgi:hypothetical protein